MEGQTILTWNVPNWITVTGMAILSFAVIAVFANFLHSRTGAKDETN